MTLVVVLASHHRRLRHKMPSEDGITVRQTLQITSATKSANKRHSVALNPDDHIIKMKSTRRANRSIVYGFIQPPAERATLNSKHLRSDFRSTAGPFSALGAQMGFFRRTYRIPHPSMIRTSNPVMPESLNAFGIPNRRSTIITGHARNCSRTSTGRGSGGGDFPMT